MPESHPNTAPLSATQLQQLEQRLESILSRRFGEISEQQLFSLLQLKPLAKIADSQLALFQLHFVLYHLLYRIAARWAEDKLAYIDIGLAKITILPWHDAAPVSPDSKAAYYANWQNYWKMTPLALSERLAQFWHFYQHRYLPNTAINLSEDEALQLLNLTWPCSLLALKRAFRKQSLLHHPDRGGDKQRFVRISLAYKKLLARF